MNCRMFEEIVSELAGDKLIDAAVRKSAFVHASTCDHCGARLADQRVLNARLRVFAEATKDELASPFLKKELLAAFAERQTAQSKLFRTAPVVEIQSVGESNRKSWPRWMLAAAAALLVFLMMSAIVWWRLVMPRWVEEANITNPTPTPAQASRTPVPEPFVTREHRDQTSARKPSDSGSPRRGFKRRIETGNPVNEGEIVSEFVPLTFAGETKALQNGFIVRVEVPRATLIAMGLPLNVERDNEAVKADVMMGDNGVAYAIRVVR